MHPSIAFPLERVVPQEGANICGFNLPHGTIVGVLPPLINRNKAIFGEDVDTFRPERWLEAEPEQLKIMERFYTTVRGPFCPRCPSTVNRGCAVSLVTAHEAVSARTLLCSRFRNLCRRSCDDSTLNGLHPWRHGLSPPDGFGSRRTSTLRSSHVHKFCP